MKNDYIVKKLYISFVVVSILSALTATAGMLIDNIIVGAFLGEEALGAMGIIGPISLIFSAFGNICSGGGTAKASQALGKGDLKKMHRIFSVTMIFVLISGTLLTIIGLLFSTQIAQLLGAQESLLEPSVDYLRGYFLGAIPTIMTTALIGFVKIDGSPRLPLFSIIVMTVTNIILDKEDSLVVRLRDNGAQFDPTKFLIENQNLEEFYGIRIIQGLASDMQYRRSLDLNNLIIKLNK